MKIVIQRSLNSSVKVNSSTVSSIDKGMVLLVCVEKNDDEDIVKKAAKKIVSLRIFEDSSSKMNRSITDNGGEILAISQFTLSWNGEKGNRPSFDNSMRPEIAETLFNTFCNELSLVVPVKKGIFGANMEVQITNDGPVTFSLSF